MSLPLSRPRVDFIRSETSLQYSETMIQDRWADPLPLDVLTGDARYGRRMVSPRGVRMVPTARTSVCHSHVLGSTSFARRRLFSTLRG
jgi:hypothetical protein